MGFIIIIIFIAIVIILLAAIKENIANNNQQQSTIQQQQIDLEYNQKKIQANNNYNEYLRQLENSRREQEETINKQLDTNRKAQEDKINEWLKNYQNTQKILIDKQLADYKQQVQESYNLNQEKQEALKIKQIQAYNDGLADYNRQAEEDKDYVQSAINDLWTQWSEIHNQVDDYQKKRDAINQEIMRQREISEQEDFYKIVLAQDDINDIAIFNEIRPRLSKAQLLDKMIYDTYIAKPTNEMIKRVLKGEAPSGIYKITRLKTGEVYIGKSTDVKARWQQHTKSAFHCGTISHSTLHTTMERDGIQQYTWELLEEVPKDKLSEREKFWITFYDSSKFGLNERIG